MIKMSNKVKKIVLSGILILLTVAAGITNANAQIQAKPVVDSTRIRRAAESGFFKAGTLGDTTATGSIAVNRDLTIRNYTPTQLVEDIFVKGGGCSAVSNVKLTTHGWNGSSWTSDDIRGLGYFTQGSSNFEMASGLVLSTGGLVSIEGPNSSVSGIAAISGTGNGNDPDLAGLLGGVTTNNYTSLEFDFVPTTQYVSFRYVFASEEYSFYVNSQFNDVFGFFISDPSNPPDFTKQNIATLPYGGGVVSINNVNWGSNSNWANHNCLVKNSTGKNIDYYINIPGSFTTNCPVPNTDPLLQSMEFNGRTVVLTATTPMLQPCKTYHMKLAVGNVGDNAYQSGVFLEAESFDLGEDLINYGNNVQGIDYVYKGCANNKFVITDGSFNTGSSVTLQLRYGGTAGNGSDVTSPDGSPLPTTVTIPVGQTSMEIPYKVNPSAYGAKTFDIELGCLCGSGYLPAKTIQIYDPAVFKITPVTDCGNPNNGQIQINVTSDDADNFGSYESSMDGGATWDSWSTSMLYTGLTTGIHTVLARDVNGCNITSRNVSVGAGNVVWTPELNPDPASNLQDWNNPDNWTPYTIPVECNTVYIPGNCNNYPLLTSNVACNDIYFMYGAELGFPNRLTYQRAFVQYNFGLKESAQVTNQNSRSLVLDNGSTTTNRMLFSASSSSDPMKRERWYMLASPLRAVLSGDLGFGGFPLTFMMKFDPVKKANQKYSVGNWTVPYTSMIEPLASNITDGFAYYVYGYGMTGDNTGCEESGAFSPALLDFTWTSRNGQSYGLSKVNGILELPFFSDSTELFAHRTQLYNQPTNKSTFYYISDGLNSQGIVVPSEFNKLTGKTDEITREAGNGNYRFAAENSGGGFQTSISHPVAGLASGDEFLVGNPYMSSIDMGKFYFDNTASIDPSFRIWNGDASSFDSYAINTVTGAVTPTNPNTSPYISPLQGFFLSYKGSGAVLFNVANISTVRPAASAFNLRSDQSAEENIIRVKAENDYGFSYLAIGYKDIASNDFVRGEDVQKLFSPVNYIPDIYSLAGDMPVAIDFINNAGDVTVPLGIKTNQTGTITLTFTGMDNYSKASKIELVDALENKTFDITGQSSYTYSFNDTENGIQEGRFSLRMEKSSTALPDVRSADDLNVYSDSKGIYVVFSEPVKKIAIYDFTGRELYESHSDAKFYPLPENLCNVPLIVKVMTENNVKTVKIIPHH